MLSFGCVLCNLICLVIVGFGAVYLYFKRSYKHWKNLGIPYLEPEFPYGNCIKTAKGVRVRPFGHELLHFYNHFKSQGHKYGGIFFFNKPSLVAVCPELIKSILTKDFHHFFDRGFYHDEENDPISAHLFALDGQKWKNLRAKLTPTFTSGKLKKMFQTLVDCSLELRDCLNEPIRKGEAVDIKQILIQYTTDVIGSCAFGLECNSFKNPNAEFIKISEKMFNPSRLGKLKFLFAFALPKLAKLLKIKMTDADIERFFTGLVKETVQYREENNVLRNDFMNLLIQLKNKGYLENEDNDDEEIKLEKTTTKLTMNELTAQAVLFFAAGLETSSTTMTWTLFELSQNQEVQKKLREEIIRVLKQYEGSITYEALTKMAYLDRVVHESLRKYPPFALLQRLVTKDYTLPDSEIVLRKGSNVFVPILGLHRDPEYYPDPDIFDPDRFTEENKSTRSDYTWLPFGEGPRNCIGLRFAMLEVKVGLCQLLINYKFTLDSGTKLPVVFDPNSVVLSAIDKIWLTADKIVA